MTAQQWRGEWDHASLPPNMRLGRDVWLEGLPSFSRFTSTAEPAIVLGDRVRVWTWSVFNVEARGVLVVGDDCALVGPQFMVRDRVEVGARCVLSYGVVIADSDFHPLDPHLRRTDAVANAPTPQGVQRPPFPCRPVVLEDDVQVGIGAMVLKGVRLGRGSRVAAGAVVTRDVPTGAGAVGNPAVVVPLDELP